MRGARRESVLGVMSPRLRESNPTSRFFVRFCDSTPAAALTPALSREEGERKHALRQVERQKSFTVAGGKGGRGIMDAVNLLQVGAHYVDQFFSGLRALGLMARLDQVRANVILDHLGHQSVDGAAGAGDELQHVGAADLLVERPFDGFDLSANAPDAIEQLGFFTNRVTH
jgi:hypothetical protein